MKLNVEWTDEQWEVNWNNAEQRSELTFNSGSDILSEPVEIERVGDSVSPALSF